DASVIAVKCRLTQAKIRVAWPSARPDTRNGSPSPSEYTASSDAPWAASPRVAPIARTEPSTGPMHGVQPNASAAPVIGAATGPSGEGLGWTGLSAYTQGERGTSEPSTKRAIDKTTTPETRVRSSWLRTSVWPTAVALSPSRMNTVEKPATNRPVSRAMRP